MKRETLQSVVGILLIVSVCLTGLLGYIQSELELRRFLPHRYLAYATLGLAVLHVYLNWGKLRRFLRRVLGRLHGEDQ